MNLPLALENQPSLDDVFQTACDLPLEKRKAYLDEVCAGNDALRREVEGLLKYDTADNSFLEQPAIQQMATQFAKPAPKPSPSSPMIGKQIANYRIQAMIGKGGMGEVYLAHDDDLNVEAAIKFLPEAYAADPEWQARFSREGRLNADLVHKNIAALRHKGEADGRPFLVFEYVPGQSLDDRLNKGPLPVKEALPIFEQLAAALAHAHSRNIIHRDLKPANIKITPEGQVKVLDFGIAKRLKTDLVTVDLKASAPDEQQTLDFGETRLGEVIGTVAYMSPEQTRGELLSTTTDLWSLGCVMYQTLTGRLPFKGVNTYDTLNLIRDPNHEPDWRALPADTPKLIRKLLQQCFIKDRLQRQTSAREVSREIDYFLRFGSLWPRRLKHRVALVGGLAILLLAAFVGGIWLRSWWIRSTVPSEKQFVVLPFKGFRDEQAGIGFADELRRSMLSVSDQLRAMPATGRNLSLLDLSAVLGQSGANLIVSGEVRQVSDQILIRYRVTNSYLYDLLNEEISGPTKSLAQLQSQIAGRIAEQFKLAVSARAAAFGKDLRLGQSQAAEQYLIAIGELQKDLNRESVEKPIAILTRLIEAEGDSARLQSALARAYLNKYVFTQEPEWLQKALQAATQAVSLSPDQPAVYQVTRGLVLLEMDETEEALKEFDAALARSPSDWEAQHGSARAYRLKRDFQQAERIYGLMVRQWPNYWDSYNELGDFYFEQGKYDKAIENWQRVVALLPENPVGYNNLASAYLQTDQSAKAIEAYLISINKDRTRDNFEARTNLGAVYFEQQQYSLAVDYFRQGLELAKEAERQDARLFGNLADAYRELARAQSLPNLAEEYNRQAAEMYDNAIKLSRQEVAANTADAQTEAYLAEWLSKRGQTTDAVAYLKLALRADPKSPEVAYAATVVYLLAGDLNQSLQWLERLACGGSSAARLSRDPELQTLRLDPRYNSIIIKCQPTNR
ncbi:MAG TPA: protein kinase [Blastocatellia bacterium]|nr:protein kinase [Blastocatellia bacterium]HMZ22629.1 protein kinase [Blastocatellia bacterium]HNG33366.1 protein kinase [Blastocatellia bacterium]